MLGVIVLMTEASNMVNRIPLFLSSAMVAFCGVGQPAYQVLLDVPSGEQTRILAVVPSTDGSVIVIFDDGPDSYVFRKFDQVGVHLWSKRVQSPAFGMGGSLLPADQWLGGWHPFISDGSGGVAYCYRTFPQWDMDEQGMDTCVTTTVLMRMGPDGEVSDFDALRHELILPTADIWTLIGTQQPGMVLFPDGGRVVLEARIPYLSGPSMLQMTRLDPAGGILWRKWYHLPGEPETQGPLDEYGAQCWMIADAENGFYMVDGMSTHVLHFNAQGVCEWAKKYLYDGNAFIMSSGLILDPATNELLITDDVLTWLGRKQIVVRISETGDLTGADVFNYAGPPNPLYSRDECSGFLSDGRLVIGENNAGGRDVLSMIGSDLSSANHFEVVTTNNGSNQFFPDLRSFAVDQTSLFAQGSCMIVDQIFGTADEYPMILRCQPDDLGWCMTSASVSSAVNALPIMSTVEEIPWLDVPAWGQYTMFPLPAPVVTNIAPPAVINLCSYTVGMPDPAPQGLFVVSPTVIQGERVAEVNSSASGLMHVVAIDGREVRSLRIPAGRSPLVLGDLAPGAYSITLVSADEGGQASQRILIE